MPGTAGGDHRGCVDDGDQHGHAEIGIDEGPGCLVALISSASRQSPR